VEELAASRQKAAEIVEVENTMLKGRLQHLETENERLRNENEKHNEPDCPFPHPPVAPQVQVEMPDAVRPASPPTDKIDHVPTYKEATVPPPNYPSYTNHNNGAVSGVAIDAVMQKLREWTTKLDEIDDSRY
jgi:hypothetical protein